MHGCAAGTVRPPLELLDQEYRPVIIDHDDRITDEGIMWLNDLVNKYLRNCAVLSTMRGENITQCRRGIMVEPRG